jgi:hypothetical protein
LIIFLVSSLNILFHLVFNPIWSLLFWLLLFLSLSCFVFQFYPLTFNFCIQLGPYSFYYCFLFSFSWFILFFNLVPHCFLSFIFHTRIGPHCFNCYLFFLIFWLLRILLRDFFIFFYGIISVSCLESLVLKISLI